MQTRELDDVVVIRLPQRLVSVAIELAEHRNKNASHSPKFEGDDKRPPKDVTGVVGELAWLRLLLGNWDLALKHLDGEVVAEGLTDGGTDSPQVDVKTSALYNAKELVDLNLPVKADKVLPNVNYVSAFYNEPKRHLYVVGYLPGYLVKEYAPRQLKADGPMNHNVPTPELWDIHGLLKTLWTGAPQSTERYAARDVLA